MRIGDHIFAEGEGFVHVADALQQPGAALAGRCVVGELINRQGLFGQLFAFEPRPHAQNQAAVGRFGHCAQFADQPTLPVHEPVVDFLGRQFVLLFVESLGSKREHQLVFHVLTRLEAHRKILFLKRLVLHMTQVADHELGHIVVSVAKKQEPHHHRFHLVADFDYGFQGVEPFN